MAKGMRAPQEETMNAFVTWADFPYHFNKESPDDPEMWTVFNFDTDMPQVGEPVSQSMMDPVTSSMVCSLFSLVFTALVDGRFRSLPCQEDSGWIS